jgi:hypothetical protein
MFLLEYRYLLTALLKTICWKNYFEDPKYILSSKLSVIFNNFSYLASKD